jgi:hypothetical protein
MTFLVRFTKSNFYREVCEIFLDYPTRLGYPKECSYPPGVGYKGMRLVYMEIKPQEPEPPGSSNRLEIRDRRA